MIWIWLAPLSASVAAAVALFAMATKVDLEARRLARQVGDLAPVIGELQELGDRSRTVAVAMAGTRQRYNRPHG